MYHSLSSALLSRIFKDKFSMRKRNEGIVDKSRKSECTRRMEKTKRIRWEAEAEEWKRKRNKRIANRETRGFDRFLPLRFEPPSLPGQMRNPSPPRADFPRLSLRIDRAGKGFRDPWRRTRAHRVKRDYDRTRFLSSEIAISFSARGAPNHRGNTLLWPIRCRADPSFRFLHRFACVHRGSDGGAAANLAQPRISMRTLPTTTYLWTSAVYVWERIVWDTNLLETFWVETHWKTERGRERERDEAVEDFSNRTVLFEKW